MRLYAVRFVPLVTLTLVLTWAAGCHQPQRCPCEMTRPTPSLQKDLDAKKAAWEQEAPPELVRTFDEGIEAVAASGVLDTALGVGDRAPDFELPDATFRRVRLGRALESGPVVLTWYRGGWCPYCNLQLAAYQDILPQIRAHGATLIAVSPEMPDHTMSTKEKGRLDFIVLSDVENLAARDYGLVYTLPPSVARAFEGRIDLAAYNGNDSNALPLAATYVIDSDGVIRYAFVEADYRQRAEPADILAALERL